MLGELSDKCEIQQNETMGRFVSFEFSNCIIRIKIKNALQIFFSFLIILFITIYLFNIFVDMLRQNCLLWLVKVSSRNNPLSS